MVILLSNLQLFNSIESLKILKDLNLPVYASFTVATLLKKLSPIIETIEEERNKIIFKFSAKTEQGELIRPLDDKGQPILNQIIIIDGVSYNNEINQLLTITNACDITILKQEDLGSIQIPPSVLVNLDWLFGII